MSQLRLQLAFLLEKNSDVFVFLEILLYMEGEIGIEALYVVVF
jgi:hypothetical protein